MAIYLHLPIYKASYALVLEIFKIVKDFDREYKYTLGENIKKEAVEMITDIYRANASFSKEVYLQYYSKGIDFLGVIIKPYPSCTHKRVKNNFYQTITKVNNILKNKNIDRQILLKVLASMNLYLGLLGHYNTYKFRKKILTERLLCFCQYIYSENSYEKIVSTI
jgi:hypothetical protein